MKILFFALVFFMGMIIPSVFAEENAPSWIKNTAGWWADNLINDNEFVNAIEFLIKEGIIKIDAKAASEKSDNIPDWIRNTAGWWATDQISETEFLNAIQFLIESGLINISNYNCNQNDDLDRNGIPDIIEETPVLSGMSTSSFYEIVAAGLEVFENKNWSNCYFPKDLSHYTFRNSDLTNADFTDSKLFNSMFDNSNLQGADFSNTNIQGSVFFASDLSHTNFENADFSTDNWEEPFVIFSYDNYPQLHPNTEKQQACYYKPCIFPVNSLEGDLNNNFFDATFGENVYPLNLGFVDSVFDESDRRSVWRHHAGFYFSNITGTIFTGSDLSYANFGHLVIRNVDFTDVNLNNVYFKKITVKMKN